MMQYRELISAAQCQKMLRASLSKPFKLIGNYAWAKVCTVALHRKYCSRSFEVTYGHNA